jgi:hypothetical protein
MTNGLMEANFGTDPAKPFAYNIEECPGIDNGQRRLLDMELQD